MFVFGFVYGTLGTKYSPQFATYKSLTNAEDPEIVFYIFLPVLLFESALNLPVYVFRKVAVPCIFLACPGLVLAAGITAGCMNLLFSTWSMSLCLLFGFIVSSTDPVAVVALLRELGTPEAVSVLIEGESLFNDGTAIFGYTVLLEVVTAQFNGGFWDILLLFITTFGGGCLMGIICGFLFVRIVSICTHEPMVEIILSFAAAYGTFYVAQHTYKVSGVVAIVVCGLYTSWNYEACITPESQELMRKVWDVAVLMANTIIFAIIGVMVAEIFWNVNSFFTIVDVLNFVAMYIIVTVARAAIVLVSYPLLRSVVGWRGAVLIVWGGLRGAVALVLAFMVYRNAMIPSKVGRPFLTQTAGIVVTTLVINGWFTKNLVHYLKLDQMSDSKLIRHRAALRIVKQTLEESLEQLHNEPLLEDANWWVVKKIAVGALDEDVALANVSTMDFHEMARVTFLDALQSSLSAQYKLGLLSVFGVNKLTNRLHRCLEEPNSALELSVSGEMFTVPGWRALMAKVPVVGVFFRQSITETWAWNYNMAIGYIVAVDSAINVCESRELVRKNSVWAHLPGSLPSNDGLSDGEQPFTKSHSFASERSTSPTYHPVQVPGPHSSFPAELKAVVAQYRGFRDALMMELRQLKQQNPSLARAVETHHAIRSVLNHGVYTVEELHREGVLDRNSEETLLHSLQRRVRDATPGAFLPIASPLMFGLLSTDAGPPIPLPPVNENTPLL
eukprot:EG_transcript_4181